MFIQDSKNPSVSLKRLGLQIMFLNSKEAQTEAICLKGNYIAAVMKGNREKHHLCCSLREKSCGW